MSKDDSHKWLKRLVVLFGGIIALFSLSGCTKSFCTNQDKANQLYAYYGDIYDTSVVVDDYAVDESGNKTDANVSDQANDHRITLYTSLQSNGYSLPDQAFLTFMETKVDTFVTENATLWTDGTLASLTTEQATAIAKHVAIYAGLNDDNTVADLWTNFDAWYDEAVLDENIGYLKAPSAGYIAALKNACNSAIQSNTSCITPDSMEFTHNGANVYVEGKTWGQAFSEYGFLEGLFVYPFAWLVHKITLGLGSTWWSQFLAILTVTLLARIVSVISSLVQANTQAKQNKVQPLLNKLQEKYPDYQTDKEQREAYSMEQAALMKKYKVHPFVPMLFLLITFPLFLCVWSALQGSAALAGGNWFGLSLTTTVSTCFTAFSTTDGAVVGIVVFFLMTIANVLSSCTSLWFTNWRNKNFGTGQKPTVDANGNTVDPNRTAKIMTYVMMAFVIIMGWNLPAGMGIYWFLSALITIIQTLIMEAVQTKNRHRLAAETGDGSTLAAIRRSAHHSETKAESDKKQKGKKDKKSKSDKPLWR